MDFPSLEETPEQQQVRTMRNRDLEMAINRTVGKLTADPHVNMGRLAMLNFDVHLVPSPASVISTLRVHETYASADREAPINTGKTIDIIVGEFDDVMGEHQMLSLALHFEWRGVNNTELVCQIMQSF